MKRMKYFFYCCMIAFALLFTASCTTTKLTSVRIDADYSGQIRKVFIIGVVYKPSVRKLFEDEFVYQLKARGVDAIPSYQVISSTRMLNKETVVSKIKELDIDAVLITKVIEKNEQKRYETQYTKWSKGWHGEYVTGHGYVYGTGDMIENETVVLKSDLFDVKTEKVIWSALSETFLMEYTDYHKEVNSFIKVMVESLSDQKLIE